MQHVHLHNGPPDGGLASNMPIGQVLARNASAAIAVTHLSVFRTGLIAHLRCLRSPAAPDAFERAQLSFEVRLDGTRAVTTVPGDHFAEQDEQQVEGAGREVHPRDTLRSIDSYAVLDSWSIRLWVPQLPMASPFELTVAWPSAALTGSLAVAAHRIAAASHASAELVFANE